MIILAVINSTSVLAIAGGAFVFWLVLAAIVAEYGHGRGYPWWPLFISGAFLSWALVLLAVTIGAGPKRKEA